MRKVWAFLEKIMIYHFYVATIMWAILKKGGGGGGAGQMSPMFSSLIPPCWDLQVTFCS